MEFESRQSRDERVAAEFRERFRADAAGGEARPLADYLALWPEDEAVVAREFQAERACRNVSQTEHQERSAGPGGAPAEVDRLGPYRIESVLGRGGQGVVYLAVDERLNRPVALKVLLGLGPGAEARMQRFRREAAVTSKLDHPGICGVYDTGVDGGVPYIAMRYVEGRTLADHLSEARAEAISGESTWLDELTRAEDAPEPEPPPRRPASATTMTRAQLSTLLLLVEKAARALHVAHEAGVVHRDVKPGNIMITRDGEPILLDFGLAHDGSEEGGPTLTRTGDVFGTPAYMSPEQVGGRVLHLDRRTDVYSLGATLYECLTNCRPFEAPTRQGLYQAILTKEPVDPRKLNRSIPTDLRVVLEAALEKDRDKRYQTAEDLAEDLAAVRELRPIRARPVGPFGRTLRWCRRHPTRAALALALAVGAPLVAYLVGYIVANRPKIEAQEHAALLEEVEALTARGFYELYHVSPARAVSTFARARGLLPSSGEAVGGEALALLTLRRPESALEALRSAPEDLPELRRIEVSVLEALGRDAEAERLEAALEEAAESAFDLFLLAQALMAEAHEVGTDRPRGKEALRGAMLAFERAAARSRTARLVTSMGYAHAVHHLPGEPHSLALIEGLTTHWPDTAMAWLWTGHAAAALGDHRRELDCYVRAEALDPELETLSRRVDALGRMGRWDEALPLARDLVRRHPESDEALSSLAVTLNNLKQLDEAAVLARKLLRRNPTSVNGHIALTHALRESGRAEEAVVVGARGVTLAPDCGPMLGQQAFSLLLAGRDEESVPLFERSIAAGARMPELERGWGEALLGAGRHEEAVMRLRGALERHPGERAGWSVLARALEALGRWSEAEAACERALALDPGDPDLLSMLANFQEAQGKLKEAEQALRRALEQEPEDAIILGQLGHCLAAAGRHEEAAAALSRSLELRPDHIQTRVNLINQLLSLDREPELLDHLRRAMALDVPVEKANATAFYGMAHGFSRLGRTEDAAACYRKSIAADPGFAEAYCNLSALERGRGALDEAITLARRGHEAGRRRAAWPYPSGDWLVDVLQLRLAEVRLEDGRRAGELAEEILRYRPDDLPALLALSRFRAAPETPPEGRRPEEAVSLALRAVRLTGRRSPAALHALAYAMFHGGFPGAAVAIQEEAVAGMGGRDVPGLEIDAARVQLERFRAGAPDRGSDG